LTTWRSAIAATDRPFRCDVVGAGLGRTGTHSLKQALEQLLATRCYHMIEVFGRPDDISAWQGAIDGEPPDWRAFFADFGAAVDWPVAGFWTEISAAFPDALVLLSTRDTDGWWTSASRTIFDVAQRAVPPDEPAMVAHMAMIDDMLDRRGGCPSGRPGRPTGVHHPPGAG